MSTSCRHYLRNELRAQFPDYKPHYIITHGHSVVTGAYAKSQIRPFDSYPHLWHRMLNEKFPTALISMIVTAIGGEHSASGCLRFETDVIARKPDLVTIDYSLNDRAIGLEKARDSWRQMLDRCAAAAIPVLLVTPTMDSASVYDGREHDILASHAQQVRDLASEYAVGLADAYRAFERFLTNGGEIEQLLSWTNHPNRAGHELIAQQLISWFPMDL